MSFLPAGTELAGYRVLALIAEGGMGTVHLAERADTGDRVALKVLPAELAENESFRRRFLRESRYAGAVDHPNVVRVVDAGEEGGRLYIAMEHVKGEDLAARLAREGRVEPDQATAILTDVAAALDAAHSAGLIHRDVKPGNVLIASEEGGERALLADFGLSKSPAKDSIALTEAGQYVGTFAYTAPEQILGGDIDGRADVYSLACVLFECLTGAPPFGSELAADVLTAHVDSPPPRLSERAAELPPAVEAAVARALAKDPADRFARCGDLLAAVGAALEASERALAPVAGAAQGADDVGSLRLKVKAGMAVGQEIVVTDEFVIGRSIAGAGRLDGDIEISRRHARIFRADGGFLVEDLGSTNGTLFNGRRIDKPELLGVGDELQMGGTTLIVQASGAGPPPEGPPIATPATAEAVGGVEEVEAEVAPAEAAPADSVPATVPRVSLRLELDLEAGEARLQLDEGSDTVRLVFEDGAWRIRPAE
jgi:pSer/pThr/pTyr-binding forkhead associated (FHA) protein